MEEYCHNDSSIYMNRWRASQFQIAFESEGFTILEFTPNIKATDEMVASEMPYLDERFQSCSREDLTAISLFIVAQKV